MGKYQLDDKGKALVQRFHEKHSKGGVNKKDRVASLREQFLNKNKKKWELPLTFLIAGRGIWNYADQHWKIKKQF